ncbi:uncharacterized protein LOC9653783 [Selaginella moellendorffii]|nr:uncharacterized protein LOC9653783 [Selaginella moellendorffii]|eukprot:XP_002985588.2 uncharacterized protein LOC9653783 [Selaginella moellendorffii]
MACFLFDIALGARVLGRSTARAPGGARIRRQRSSMTREDFPIHEGLKSVSISDAFTTSSEDERAPEQSCDEISKPDVEQKLRGILSNAGVSSFHFKRVPADYYEKTLEERKEVLGAVSIDHLCKSMVMVNTQAPSHITDCSDRKNSKYYVIVVQYNARLNAEKVKKFIYDLNEGKIPKKRFNLRLAPEEESQRLSGYEHNAVTPIGMRTDIPVILSDAIANLKPDFFWLGGGDVDLKLGINTQEFIALTNPFVIDCTYSEG